ncbi:MAG TPA: hypothetical protein VE129_17595, partial [Thermoanaerobaculia bacterium]|nr:hypothetical protein [Thermoanaerobaculia bacterium]
MPRPLGRDRLESTTDETIVLLSLRPKPWAGREEVSPRAPVLPGTAVRWDGELYEVLTVEPREGGGFRHVLAPWDDRYLVRNLVEYGDGGEPHPSDAAVEASVTLQSQLQPQPQPQPPRPVPAVVPAPVPAPA